jgi:hypothetical protein
VKILVDIFADGERPPAGTPVEVQLLDTALQDAPARTLAEATTYVENDGGAKIASVEVPFDDDGEMPTVRVRVNVTGGANISRGDYITVQSFGVPRTSAPRMQVRVRKI